MFFQLAVVAMREAVEVVKAAEAESLTALSYFPLISVVFSGFWLEGVSASVSAAAEAVERVFVFGLWTVFVCWAFGGAVVRCSSLI